ncbi:MAG: hypothetical protein H3C69_09705 [Candidatus Promineofilum sp.]|nr:hypothetical protein [Promineifilum sp.]
MITIPTPRISTGPFTFGQRKAFDIRLDVPPLLEWQAKVVRESARFNVVCVGRRAGKTALGIDRIADPAMRRYPVAWFAPSYKFMVEVWREVEFYFAPIIVNKNKQERRMEFNTGGVLDFWSLDSPIAGRGRKYKRVIVDEAAFIPDLAYIWHAVIRNTLADYRGDAWIMSTPKGRNGFWELWRRGEESDAGWRSWQMPTEVNPLLAPEEIAELRQGPERIVAQEVDAMFLDDAGGVFRRVMEAATATPQDSAVPGHQYIMGIDWARSRDFTVLAIVDATLNQLVYLDRFNQIDYAVQRGRVLATYERFKPERVIAEMNAMGAPMVEQLMRDGLPVEGFTTTNATKAAIIDALALAFEQGALAILPDPTLINELQSYEMDRSPSGLMRYGAPSGMHDDTVMALAMAWYGAVSYEPIFYTL